MQGCSKYCNCISNDCIEPDLWIQDFASVKNFSIKCRLKPLRRQEKNNNKNIKFSHCSTAQTPFYSISSLSLTSFLLHSFPSLPPITHHLTPLLPRFIFFIYWYLYSLDSKHKHGSIGQNYSSFISSCIINFCKCRSTHSRRIHRRPMAECSCNILRRQRCFRHHGWVPHPLNTNLSNNFQLITCDACCKCAFMLSKVVI